MGSDGGSTTPRHEAESNLHSTAGAHSSAPSPQALSFFDRFIASVAGSVSTSFLMTPLDVIKTRLQMQANDASLPVHANIGPIKGPPCPVHGTAPHESARASTRVSWLRPSTPLTVPFAMNSPTMCIYPEKCSVAKLCETEVVMREGRLTGVWDGIVKVARVEGWQSLWRGLLPTLAMTIPSQVTYMSFYDVFRQAILSFEAPVPVWQGPIPRPAIHMPDFPCDMPCEHDELVDVAPAMSFARVPLLIASLMSGACARAISATLVTPLELLRTRLQASHGRSSFLSVIQPLGMEVKQHGVHVLWRGLSATLWRDVPFSALYFTGYEGGKVLLTGRGFGESQTSTFWHEFGISFIVGASRGCVAAFATHPFDLVKTRLQAEQAQRAVYVSSRSLFSALRRIVVNDGVQGLFCGLSPRLAKVAPSCGIMIGAFEAVSRLLRQSHA